MAELGKRSDPRRWTRGIVVIGDVEEVAGHLDAPVATLAGPVPDMGTLAAVRIGGMPALLVSDVAGVSASRLIGSPAVAATRGVAAAIVGASGSARQASERISFTELGLTPALAEVFGRADISVAIDGRMLPPGTKAARLALDAMVAPDGAGERAVVSVFVNERLLGSSVAQIDDPTRFDLPLPDGLVGAIANVRVVIQRRSAEGDCRFEPQGYPAQILGTSSVVLAPADAHPHDFSDLAARWADGVDILVPERLTAEPEHALAALSAVLAALAPEAAVIKVKPFPPGAVPIPEASFIGIGDAVPQNMVPRAQFHRGRVVVKDRQDRTVLDLGGFSNGAVAQLVMAGDFPGLWLKPLAADGTLPSPTDLHLEHGDVAFIDRSGVAMALSTERDTLVRIAYPEAVSWFTVAERFRSWIIGGLWLLATCGFLLGLQRVLRRRGDTARQSED